MRITILSPEQELFNGDIKSVQAPGVNGLFEVLENHAPLVAALGRGQVRLLTEKGEKLTYDIPGGFIEVLNNEVSLLVNG
ncbi:MAG: ATP synthase F1 subunit epsilon [Saprospiraceae bacterium]